VPRPRRAAEHQERCFPNGQQTRSRGAAQDQLATDQKGTLDSIRSVSGDLHTIESSLLMISLKLGR
jgi:hypothetical protein